MTMNPDNWRPQKNWYDEERRILGQLQADAAKVVLAIPDTEDPRHKEAVQRQIDLDDEGARLAKARRDGVPYKVRRFHYISEERAAVSHTDGLWGRSEIDPSSLGHGKDVD